MFNRWETSGTVMRPEPVTLEWPMMEFADGTGMGYFAAATISGLYGCSGCTLPVSLVH